MRIVKLFTLALMTFLLVGCFPGCKADGSVEEESEMKKTEVLDDYVERGTSKRVMTFNVWNVWKPDVKGAQGERYRIEGCAEVILENSPDFVCLQEYDHWYRCHSDGLHYKLISEKYAEALPDGVDPNYVWNPVFYDKEKYTLIENGIVDFKAEGVTCYESAHYPDESDTSHFRTLVWAVLEDKTDKNKYIIGNLHYSVIGKEKNGIYTHENEAKLVIDKIKALCEKYNAISLVCGDYNSLARNEGSGGYRFMIDAGFVDTYMIAEQKNDLGSCGEAGKIVERKYSDGAIDHVMTLSPISVEAYYTLNSECISKYSDHRPVVVQFNK